MAGDVVACSLPVAACSSFAARRVVCRYIRIMASMFCMQAMQACMVGSNATTSLLASQKESISQEIVRKSPRRGDNHLLQKV